MLTLHLFRIIQCPNKISGTDFSAYAIDVLNVRLNFLIVWPEREELIEAMPAAFQLNFGNRVAVITDCFVVFMNVYIPPTL